jgi:2,4'-dihydroxyacetophenone dioxygenase
MTQAQVYRSDNNNIGSFGDSSGRVVVHADELPWTDWAMEGLRFKLLSINRRSGMFAVMMEISPNVVTDLHHHFGDAHIFVTRGGYAYEHDRIGLGEHNVEIGSIAHQPFFDEQGGEVLVYFHGGISGVDENGKPTGEYVSADWMYEAAKANGAADHLTPPPIDRSEFH